MVSRKPESVTFTRLPAPRRSQPERLALHLPGALHPLAHVQDTGHAVWFELGWQARQRGDHLTAHPVTGTTAQLRQWRRGWEYAHTFEKARQQACTGVA